MKKTVVACILAATMLLAGAGGASAAIFGIDILTPLTTQRGTIRIPAGPTFLECEVELTKSFVDALVVANPFGLTRIGRIESLRFTPSITCPSVPLNVPARLGDLPGPGPALTSWDISYLTSDINGDLLFGILDFQISPGGPLAGCLYRGTLLGRMGNGGSTLTLLTTSPLTVVGAAPGCRQTITVSGTLIDNPPVSYLLLNR